ncbi:MAG: pirin family protein [Dehalococcoidia bacterium]
MPATTLTPKIDIRRSEDRFKTDMGWLNARHSFSFNWHYDPDNTHFGLLLVNNQDLVQPNTGFETHPHRDMEIVTWITQGGVEHKDSEGHAGLIVPGEAQRMSAGRGIFHSEINGSSDTPLRLVQMWVVPDQKSFEPSYEQTDISRNLKSGELVAVASGKGLSGAVKIHQEAATLWAARLAPGESVQMPSAPYVHLFVPVGSVDVEGVGELHEGDAMRFTAAESHRITGLTNSEVLIWEMDRSLRD